jgi:hypothetical protein
VAVDRGFTIPNPAAGLDQDQSQVDKVDLDILAAGIRITGVLAGGAVTAQGSPDMTVNVDAVNGRVESVAVSNAGDSGLVFGAADALLPRYDLIVVDQSGALSVFAGTPTADNPPFPDDTLPAPFPIVLAAVRVGANVSEITTADIVDKRVMLSPEMGMVRLVSCPIAYNAAGLATGYPIYTPTIGDILLDFWMIVDTVWDGTTPQGDVGWASDASTTFGARYFAAWWQLIYPDSPDFSGNQILNAYNNPSIDGAIGTGVTLTASQRDAFCVSTGDQINRIIPFVFLTTDPLLMFVTDGVPDVRNGTDPGSSQGAGRVMLLVATP